MSAVCPEPGRHAGRPQRKCPAVPAVGQRSFHTGWAWPTRPDTGHASCLGRGRGLQKLRFRTRIRPYSRDVRGGCRRATTCAGGRRAMAAGHPVQGVRPPRTPAWPPIPACPRTPGHLPSGRRLFRSSGRSIRRSLWLIPTSSTLPQGPPDMWRADPPGADVASCPIRSRRRSGGTSAATRAPISASLAAGSVDHGQARGGGRGQYDPSSQASGGAAACVSETPPSAAQDAREAEGQSS